READEHENDPGVRRAARPRHSCLPCHAPRVAKTIRAASMSTDLAAEGIGDAPGIVVIVAHVSDRPTIRDVAREAGVSVATVSRALNDKDDVSVETRERVRRAARDLRYTVDPSARALGSQRTRLVAVLVGDNAGPRDMSLIF